MILILEIAFLIAGIYSIFTAKMPSWIVGKGYKAEGAPVRLLGFLMALTLPGVLCGSFTIGLLGPFADYDPTVPAVVFEIFSVIMVAIIVMVTLRRIRQPDFPTVNPPSQ